jgi:hypothetical protein
MIAYIQQMIDDLLNRVWYQDLDQFNERAGVLAEELKRLDPRDFAPARRFEFTQLRLQARLWAVDGSGRCWGYLLTQLQTLTHRRKGIVAALEEHRLHDPNGEATKEQEANLKAVDRELSTHTLMGQEIEQECRGLREVLDYYGGQGSRIITRDFAFVSTDELRGIVERDYRELVVALIPSGAWKSAVVMAGSVLEAILYDQLTRDATSTAAAMNSPKAPRKKGGAVRDILSDSVEDDWTLSKLIDVSAELGVLPAHRIPMFDHVLRDYRNIVHPRKELRVAHNCNEAEATLAKGALDAVCDLLTP